MSFREQLVKHRVNGVTEMNEERDEAQEAFYERIAELVKKKVPGVQTQAYAGTTGKKSDPWLFYLPSRGPEYKHPHVMLPPGVAPGDLYVQCGVKIRIKSVNDTSENDTKVAVSVGRRGHLGHEVKAFYYEWPKVRYDEAADVIVRELELGEDNRRSKRLDVPLDASRKLARVTTALRLAETPRWVRERLPGVPIELTREQLVAGALSFMTDGEEAEVALSFAIDASCDSPEDLDELVSELNERFGAEAYRINEYRSVVHDAEAIRARLRSMPSREIIKLMVWIQDNIRLSYSPSYKHEVDADGSVTLYVESLEFVPPFVPAAVWEEAIKREGKTASLQERLIKDRLNRSEVNEVVDEEMTKIVDKLVSSVEKEVRGVHVKRGTRKSMLEVGFSLTGHGLYGNRDCVLAEVYLSGNSCDWEDEVRVFTKNGRERFVFDWPAVPYDKIVKKITESLRQQERTASCKLAGVTVFEDRYENQGVADKVMRQQVSDRILLPLEKKREFGKLVMQALRMVARDYKYQKFEQHEVSFWVADGDYEVTLWVTLGGYGFRVLGVGISVLKRMADDALPTSCGTVVVPYDEDVTADELAAAVEPVVRDVWERSETYCRS